MTKVDRVAKTTGPAHHHGAQHIRTAAGWTIAAFAGIGTLLVVGISVSDIGGIEDRGRLGAALVGAGLAMGGAAVAIVVHAGVLAPRDRTLSMLAGEETALVKRQDKHDNAFPIRRALKRRPRASFHLQYLTESPELRRSWDSIEALRRDVQLELDDYQAAYRTRSDEDTEEGNKLLAGLARDGSPAVDAWSSVAGWANYAALVAGYRKGRWGVLVSAMAVGIGLALFGWAANPPEQQRPSLRGAILVEADLRAANLTNADLSNSDLTKSNLEGARLDGADLADVIWSDTTCPDGTNSDNQPEGQAPTCIGHLDAQAAAHG